MIGKHLDKGDPEIVVITESLIKALRTPSESVQRAVAEGLTPLVQVFSVLSLILNLLKQIFAVYIDFERLGSGYLSVAEASRDYNGSWHLRRAKVVLNFKFDTKMS